MAVDAPDLRITLTKRRDGAVVSRLQRADGSATWQRCEGATAQVLALHDLTHHAVETTLGHRRGFYGLVAEGWDLADFGTPWPRGPLPPDPEPAELIAGLLDTERGTGETWTAAQFNAHAATHGAQRGTTPPPPLDDATLLRVRDAVQSLRARWLAVPPGESLQLTFSR